MVSTDVVAVRTGITCTKLKNPLSMATKQCVCSPCHLCEYSLSKMKCQLIKDDGLVLSDGSELTLQQPVLQPTEWFLTKEEITQSRGGVPRSNLQTYSKGNKVVVFPSSDQYFLFAYRDIERSGANDTVYLAGWGVDNVPFDPINDPTGKKSSFQSIMKRAVQRGADFRALVWANQLEREQNLVMRDFINTNLTKPTVSGPARFVFDDRVPYLASSHHQKSLILRQQNKLVAYLGGVDLTTDRWDTINHDQSKLRDQVKISRYFNGWVDAHYRIEGPAALDVGNNFLQRWNSAFKPTLGKIDDLLDFENPGHSALPPLSSNGPLDLNGKGPHMVQITRTFSCKYKHYEEFAPRGENSLFQARIKAIKAAKNFIYIEDQYFVLVPELLDALLEVLPRIQRLIVVAQRVMPDTKVTGYDRYSFDMVAPIQKRFPNKFQLYTTKEAKNLYIHSKVVIVDDVYLSIGSSNWNRRSMTSDSEIGANVVDTETVETPEGLQVGKLVRNFRLSKFMEMTGKSVASLAKMKLIDAANAFDTAAEDPASIIERLQVEDSVKFVAFGDVVRQKIDPDDKC
ncbi:hypothetical protein Poli38472_012324 [Pythium oligandrum]|uniref:phospholipase D n=1 Tax=Pythium oligandrum TaxID=41045 RepID=A0A8K1CRX0_PYTOL|nr:hypothetical protein Poli38472_012324 [Pythium oligandrum]|eukprot:TMW67208.1 hypothetical protein Poli38472_012324 [Pythium oligandrum]